MGGNSSWEMIHSGFMNLYSGHDCIDFDETMTPQMNSPCAIEVTKIWLELIKSNGAENWNASSEKQMLTDFNQGNVTMIISDSFLNSENTAYAPIPDGQHTHVGIESLAMNARSKNKDAAWLFMQWATGKEFLSSAAISYTMLNPVRVSIWENPEFQETLSPESNYLETFNTLIASDMKVQFTPQPLFFETTAQWAKALKDIYAGVDIQERLDELASSISEQLKYARFE
jgi:multiple sugar transport system substrate-binding protein